ncbi:MAG TPA: hypothetical protein DCQ06_12805 [Myxococcales bacterium]|nr:hypothetical protein [Myxococcales bacterium]HAN32468.1 hypothetical protein [Myxococcales bacterium]
MSKILEVSHLSKTFRVGLLARPVVAVRDVSFSMEPGQVLGYLGPNGSGKTTSIKCILGLIQPSQGDIRLFGQSSNSAEARTRVGYMPEHPYFYDYLKPTEVLDYVGQLFGIDAQVRRKRIPELLERLGLGHAMDRTLRGFSKGMLQRVGIAQSLLNDPDLLIYDEPMSGLDPVGRKELRELLVELREEGRSIFITSHILSDIENICDSVVILNQGVAIAEGPLDTLLQRDKLQSSATIRLPSGEQRQAAVDALVALPAVTASTETEGAMMIRLPTDAVPQLSAKAAECGAHLVDLQPVRDTLEELFMRKAVTTASDSGDDS